MYFLRWPAAPIQKGGHPASLQNEAGYGYGIFQKMDYLCTRFLTVPILSDNPGPLWWWNR